MLRQRSLRAVYMLKTAPRAARGPGAPRPARCSAWRDSPPPKPVFCFLAFCLALPPPLFFFLPSFFNPRGEIPFLKQTNKRKTNKHPPQLLQPLYLNFYYYPFLPLSPLFLFSSPFVFVFKKRKKKKKISPLYFYFLNYYIFLIDILPTPPHPQFIFFHPTFPFPPPFFFLY